MLTLDYEFMHVMLCMSFSSHGDESISARTSLVSAFYNHVLSKALDVVHTLRPVLIHTC